MYAIQVSPALSFCLLQLSEEIHKYLHVQLLVGKCLIGCDAVQTWRISTSGYIEVDEGWVVSLSHFRTCQLLDPPQVGKIKNGHSRDLTEVGLIDVVRVKVKVVPRDM